jgi:hypothetical protein
VERSLVRQKIPEALGAICLCGARENLTESIGKRVHLARPRIGVAGSLTLLLYTKIDGTVFLGLVGLFCILGFAIHASPRLKRLGLGSASIELDEIRAKQSEIYAR